MSKRARTAARPVRGPRSEGASRGGATPVNWRIGDDVIIPPAVSNDEALRRFPQGWRTLEPYLRVVKLAD
ncbi:MAG TPA: hypothetical protein VF139_19525 [Candidatus Polarisedimenticolaceae bacterium]